VGIVGGIVISPANIDREIVRLVNEMEKETDDYAYKIMEAAESEAAYKAEWAKWFITGVGTVAIREQLANRETAGLYEQRKMKEALAQATKEKLLSLRHAIDALRTLAANVRVQV
jgi:hypothetical protein